MNQPYFGGRNTADMYFPAFPPPTNLNAHAHAEKLSRALGSLASFPGRQNGLGTRQLAASKVTKIGVVLIAHARIARIHCVRAQA